MTESKKITNPFPGLRPFESDEYRLFFGREGQADALISRLQRSRFLAVVGTSGSGKSSLVRAGLLPALRGGMMAGAGSGWRIAIMRPGSDPIGNLALALAQKEVLLNAGGGLPQAEVEAIIEASLRRGSLGLLEVARQARLAEPEKLLVVVDQFEELFRFRAARGTSSTIDDASAFVKLLLEAAQQREFSIYVVPTMRSDFLGDCAQFQGLPEAINEGQYLIPRMTRDERRFAISGPIGVTRGKITEPLINRLMNDVGDNPDQLPILQHALMRTWYSWAAHRLNGDPIGLNHYEAIGTMSDALSKHADEAYEQLAEHLRPVCETLFKSLTERGADNREIRRPTRLKDICEIAGASAADVIAVIEVFRDEGCSFLMPPAGVELKPETIIDISHESLIRNWVRLKEWVKDEAESARTYRRLAEAAMDYHAGARGLLDDVTLQYVLKWREKSNPQRAWGVRYHPEFGTAMGYLEESRVARDSRVAAERERERRELETSRAFADKQARAARRMRWLTAGMAVMFVLALATAALAWKARGTAEVAKLAAEKNALAAIASKKEADELRIKADEQKQKAIDSASQAERQRLIAAENAGKAERAKKDTLVALKRAESEAVRANQQARIAEQNQQAADLAKTKAQKNAEQLQLSEERSALTRTGLEAFRREEFGDALDAFDCLREKLEALQTNATASTRAALKPCAQVQPPEAAEKFAVDLGWTLSNIGSTHQKKRAFPEAIESYEKAIEVFRQANHIDSNDRILLDTYEGVAQSYYDLAKSGRPGAGNYPDTSTRDEDFRKAQEFFIFALRFQKQHRPSEAASGHSNLARLYVDTGKFDYAKENFNRVVDLRRLGKKSRDLNSAERAALVAAFRELAEFYQGQGAPADAISTFNEMLVVQVDIPVSELADQGQEIAKSYAELAQSHAAIAEAAKADAKRINLAIAEATETEKEQVAKDEAAGADAAKSAQNIKNNAAAKAKLEAEKKAANEKAAFHTSEAEKILRGSNLLQETTRKLRLEKSHDNLDDLGNVYSQLGVFNVAEEIYLDVLNQRSPDELWKSYDTLATFYRENKKDPEKAGIYKKGLEQEVNGNTERLMQLGAIHWNDPYRPEVNKTSDAEKYYTAALTIFKEQANWSKENLVYVRLSRLYSKDKRLPERPQIQRERVDVLGRYFKQLDAKVEPLPKDPVTLVHEYLYAINALAYGNKNIAEAEATYKRTLEASDYVRNNINDSKILEFYLATLNDYAKLLKKPPTEPTRAAEAAKVLEQMNAVREKLKRLGGASPAPP